MSPRLPAGTRARQWAVIAAAALFVAIFAARLAIEQSDVEVLLLCTLPIAILAAEFGLPGGLFGACVAAVLLAFYVVFFDPETGAWLYAGRVTAFAALAALVAALAGALRRLTIAHAQVDREIAARRSAERDGAELVRLADERRHLALEVVAAEEEARRRIAEDLHDGALQTLLAAKQDLTDASPGRAGVIRALQGMDEGIECLRRAVGMLHPVTIEHDGLVSALGVLTAEAGRRGGFECVLQVEERAGGPHDHMVLSLARELLANAVKHSRAGHVLVHVGRDRGWLQLEVSDDGCGFDASGRLAAPCDGHIGLASAERRARALGGSLEIAAGPEVGTTVSVRLPLDGTGADLAATATVTGRP